MTREQIEAGRSDKGGWSKKQLALIGVAWPPPNGWVEYVLKRDIPPTVVAEFIRLKG